MVTNSAEMLRNFMLKSILFDNTLKDVQDLDDGTRVYLFSKKIKALTENDDTIQNSLAVSSIATAYMDAYKYLNYKVNTMQADDYQRNVFTKINNVWRMDDLIALMNEDDFVLEDLYSYQLEFIRQSDLIKDLMYKMMSEQQWEKLQDATMMYLDDDPNHCNNISSLYIDDFDNAEKDGISIEEDIIKYYNDRKNTIEAKEQTEIAEDEHYQIVKEICGFMSLLSAWDYETFCDIVEYAATKEYTWNKYIIGHDYYGELINLPVKKIAVTRYEMLRDNKELTEVYFNQKDMLFDLMNSFIEIKCYNDYISDDFINDDLVDEYYYETEVSKKI